MEQIFGMHNIRIKDEGTSIKFRIPWKGFDEQTLPRTSQRITAWSNNQAQWKTAYHGTRMEGLAATIRNGGLVAGPSRKLFKSGVFCFQEDLIRKAYTYAIWVPLFVDGFFWRAAWDLRVDRSDSNFNL